MQQRKKERENEKQKSRTQKTEAAPTEIKKLTNAEKEAAKLEKKVADITVRKDAIENEIAIACEKNDLNQLKDLNITHAELQKQLQAAETALEAAIAKL